MSLSSLEDRLAAVEEAVVSLQKKIDANLAKPNWLHQIAGIMADMPEEAEYLAEFSKRLRSGEPVPGFDR